MMNCVHGKKPTEYCEFCAIYVDPKEDEVNNPAHYKLFPDMEAFDVIKATLTPEELRGYLKGNILKYRLRAGQKGPVEKCVAKADWYKARLFEQEQA